MSLLDLQIPALANDVKFEDLCLALFQADWQDSTAQKNGRRGQRQDGVDIFGVNHRQDGKLWGVQCKCKDARLGRKLTTTEIDIELAKAERFDKELAHLIIATTAATDAKIQKYVRKLSAARAKLEQFPVTVFAWEKLQQLLADNLAVARQFYPEHFVDSIKQSTKPAFHLPEMRLSPHFADPAKHLDKLRQTLMKGKSATVQGMGGVGKTQLALKYCQQYRDDYAGVWWFSAESLGLLETECMAFCHSQQIALVENIPAPQALRDWLAARPAGERPWLLVYDNADDAKGLKKFLPHASGHHVLITSRLPVWAGMGLLHLDVWTGEQALAFLRPRFAGEDDAALLALTKTLDGLPLALEQACAYLDNQHIAVADYIDRINAAGQDVALLGRVDSDDCARSVLATLSLAFDKLSEPAMVLLMLCAYFAPEPVPEYVFTENPDDMPEMLQAAAGDKFLWRETVAELERYALCQTPVLLLADHMGNNGTNERCLVLHRLTQTAVRAEVERVAGAGGAIGGNVIALLHGAFPLRADYPEHWPRCRSLMPHVQRLAVWYDRDKVAPVPYADLLGQLAIYLKYGPALLSEALRLERRALTILQTALGEEHPDTVMSMGNLATTLWHQGDLHDARLLQEMTLEICRRKQGEEHSDTLTAMNNLATTLWAQDDLPGARSLEEEALDIRRRVFGEEDLDTLTAMDNLAGTLWRQGDLPGARLLQEKTLDISRRLLREEQLDTLKFMNNLASTLRQQGDLTGARSLQEKTLTSLRRKLGEAHANTLTTQGNLAITLENLGEHAAAQALRDDIAAIRSKAKDVD
jgi:tetratricopeptide (TPR) repeat protein